MKGRGRRETRKRIQQVKGRSRPGRYPKYPSATKLKAARPYQVSNETLAGHETQAISPARSAATSRRCRTLAQAAAAVRWFLLTRAPPGLAHFVVNAAMRSRDAPAHARHQRSVDPSGVSCAWSPRQVHGRLGRSCSYFSRGLLVDLELGLKMTKRDPSRIFLGHVCQLAQLAAPQGT